MKGVYKVGKIKRYLKIIIFSVLCFCCFIAISISIGMIKGEENAKKTINEMLPPAITITEDFRKVEQDFQNNKNVEIDLLSLETIKEIGKLEEVEYYDYSTPTYIEVENLQTVNLLEDEQFFSTIKLEGTSKPEMLDLKIGMVTLAEGRTFTEEEIEKGDYVAVISKEFADINNIKVNDIVTSSIVITSHLDSELSTTTSFDLKIVGLYSLNYERDGAEKDKIYSLKEKSNNLNVFYLPNKVSKQIINEQEIVGFNSFPDDYEAFAKSVGENITGKQFLEQIINEEYYEPVYLLNSKEDELSFREKATTLLDDNKYTKLLSNSSKFDYLMMKIPDLPSLFTTIMFVGAVFTVILICMLFRCVQKSKNQIRNYLLTGFFVLFATTISLFIGHKVSIGLPYEIIFPHLRIDGEILEHASEHSHEDHEHDLEEQEIDGNIEVEELEMLEAEMDEYAYNRIDKKRISLREVTKAYTSQLEGSYILMYVLIIIISISVGFIASLALSYLQKIIKNE